MKALTLILLASLVVAPLLADETGALTDPAIASDAAPSPAADPATVDAAPAEQPNLAVTGVVPGSPAERAGIQPGDVFKTYVGTPVSTLDEVNKLKQQVTTDSVEVRLIRGGQELAIMLPAGQMGVFLKELLPDLEYGEGDVVIEGIPQLDWSLGKSNSYLAALEAVANHLGIDKDYVWLNGVSGAAFRLHFHEDWCPSSPDPGCGYPTCNHALDALGLKHEGRHVEEDDEEGRAKLKQDIIASIDAGYPVIGIDIRGVPEWGIITGYRKGGEELLCRSYFDRREGYDIAEKIPWGVTIISGLVKPAPELASFQTSFKVAHENLTTEQYGDYYSGLAAFDYWLDQLRNTDFDAIDEERFREEVSHANAWIYERLAEDREYAAQYLELIAPDFPDQATELEMLAQLYREESEVLKPTEDVIVYSFQMKDRSDWSAEKRAEQVARLTEARGKEEQARELWEQLIAAPEPEE